MTKGLSFPALLSRERIRLDQLSAHLHREEEESASARREWPRGVDARIDEHSLVTASQGSAGGRWWARLVEEVALSSQLQKLFGRYSTTSSQLTTQGTQLAWARRGRKEPQPLKGMTTVEPNPRCMVSSGAAEVRR